MTHKKDPYKLFVFILFCFVLSGKIFPQSYTEPSKMKQFNITVNFDDCTVKTQMLSQEKKITLDNDRTYMWYAAQKIMETKGGYTGKLIHGTYTAFYLNNQLKEQGDVKYGLRHKVWKYWYPDGKLKEIITWKNGVKNGPYYLYNDYGQLMAKSNFKNDKLNGKFYTYGNNGVMLEKKKYKNGNEVQKKVSPFKQELYPVPADTQQKPKQERLKKEPDQKTPKKKKKSDSAKSADKEAKKKVITS